MIILYVKILRDYWGKIYCYDFFCVGFDVKVSWSYFFSRVEEERFLKLC